MHRINWGTHSGVVVDRCEDHGTWFDEGELDKVREFVLLGGVEYEKYRKSERGLNDLLSKVSRETTRLNLRIDSAYRRARFWSMLRL